MPNSTNYGSTGRPPGKFHLRHSTSRATGFFSNFLEFSQPPFDIFSIGIANNNNNICYYDNGGIKTPINLNTSTYDDNKETDTAHSIHRTDKEKWFDLIFNKSNNNNSITSNNNNSNNNDNDIGYYNGGIKTPISLSAYDDNKEADTAHSIHRTDKTKWFDLIFNKNNNNDSISNNSNNEFDTSSLSYSTNAFPTTTTPTTTTDYNTSTNDKDDEDKALNNNRRMAAKDNISNGTKRNEFDAPPTADTTTTTTTTPTIDYNTSAYDDNNKANIIACRIHRTDKSTVKQFDSSKNNNSTNRIELTFNNNINNNNNNVEFDTSPISISTYDDNKEADTAHSIHRTDKTKWFDLIFNKNNNNNNTSNNIDCASTVTSSTTTSTTTNDETFHLPFLFKDHDKEDGISTDVAFGSRSLNQIISNNYNNEFDASPTADTPTTTTNITTTTTTTTIIDYNTSANDKNDKEKALNNNRRTLAAKDINNNNISSNNKSIDLISSNDDDNNNNNIIDSSITTSTTTITVTKDKDKTFRLSVLFKLISLYLNSSSPKEFNTAYHQQQQQQHYHGKQRYQFQLEQQQKHQHFKQGHNKERMVTSIVLKLTLVAWDIWAFRNVY